MRIAGAAILTAAIAAPATAQIAPTPNTITIAASGRIETPPDIATLSLSIRGEGKTPDVATTALAGKQKAILAGLQRLDPKLIVRTGTVSIREVRTGRCAGGMLPLEISSDSMTTMADKLELAADALETEAGSLSDKGPCRLVGMLAEISAEVVLGSVKQAGTAIGLAGRLGAASAGLDGFGLRDPAAATRRAIADAIANARTDAQTIAAASGATLGPLISVTNADQGRRVFNAYDIEPASYSMAPAVAAPPPIVLDVAPKPVETSAHLIVTFGLAK